MTDYCTIQKPRQSRLRQDILSFLLNEECSHSRPTLANKGLLVFTFLFELLVSVF